MPMNNRLLRPRARGGFDPRTISGLALWLDPSDSATLGNTSSGTGGATNNGPVKYVADKSGNGRHATQSGADSVAPTLLANALNGKAVLGYDGGDSLAGAFGNLAMSGQTTFVVLRMATAASNFGRVFAQAPTGTSFDFNPSGHYIPMLRNVTTNAICSFSGGAARSSVSVSTNQWVVFSSRHNGSQIDNRVNAGSYVSASGQTLAAAFDSYRIGVGIGTGPDTAFWQDRIGELLSYGRSLTDSEASRVVSYLMSKYGIT